MTRAFVIAKKAAGFVPASQRQACRNCARKSLDKVAGKALLMCREHGMFVTEMAVCSTWEQVITPAPAPATLELVGE